MVVNIEKQNGPLSRNIAPQPGGLFHKRRGGRAGFSGNLEPDLGDLLADPILHRLLASDGVASEHLVTLITDMRHKLSLRPAL
jgi:hypothetical protein